MDTLSEIGYIYKRAQKLMQEREQDYKGSWRTEGLSCMIGSLKKKGSQAQVMLESGRTYENVERSKEDLLDAINYAALAYRLLEMDGNCKECCIKNGYAPFKGCPFDGVHVLDCGKRLGGLG